MSDDKPFRVLGPYPKNTDRQQLSWLARESAHQKMASDGYEILTYAEREVPLEEVPPTATKHLISLGLNPEDFMWFEYSGIGRVNRSVLDWLVAECTWQREQLALWVRAERDWQREQTAQWLAAERDRKAADASRV